MKDNFNALTEARLEKLEERVHSVEVILLFMTADEHCKFIKIS